MSNLALQQCISILRDKGKYIIDTSLEILKNEESSKYSKALKKLNALIKIFVNGDVPNLSDEIYVLLNPLSCLIKRDDIEEDIQIMILEMFINITTIDFKFTHVIFQNEILDYLKKFLTSHSTILRKLSAWLLCNVAVDENIVLKVYLVNEGILDLVIKLILNETKISVLKHQANLLLNLLSEIKKSKVELETFQKLFNFMTIFIDKKYEHEDERENVKICFLKCFYKFSISGDLENLKVILDSGLHLLFPSIVKEKTDISLKIFLSIIHYLIFPTDVYFTNTLLDNGLMQTFTDILSDGNYDENIRINVIVEIGNIVCDSYENISLLFIDTPLLPILIEKFQHDTLNCKKEIIWVFKHLTNNVDVVLILLNLKIVELTETLLFSLSFKEDYEYWISGVQLLINLMYTNEISDKLTDSFKQQICHYSHHGYGKLRKEAMILSSLFD
jgi:hypothetical protein